MPTPLEWAQTNGFAALRDLAPQERLVLRLILEGKHDKEIATAMHLKMPTVRTYLRRIFDKTGACDRRELMALEFARMWASRTPTPAQERGGPK